MKVTSMLRQCGFIIFVIALLLVPRQVAADEYFPVSYSGRLTQASGAPLEGPVDIELSFWSSPSDGSKLGRSVTKTGVGLLHGVFAVQLPLDGAEVSAIFGDGTEPVYIQVTAAGKTYPRQVYMFTPLALRVPVDSSHFGFDTASGKLRLKMDQSATNGTVLTSDGRGGISWKKIEAAQLVAKGESSAAPTDKQVLTYINGEWVASDIAGVNGVVTGVAGIAPITVTGSGTAPRVGISQSSGTSAGYLSSADWTTFNSKQSALGFSPVNKSGDTMGGALNMNAQPLTGLATPSSSADAATKGYVDGTALRKDGTVPLSASWDVGAKDITNTGSIQMADSQAFGVSKNSVDPTFTGDSDKGKVWFNSTSNELKYYDGTTVKTLGLALAGTAGTYLKVTTDAYGRVTSGSPLSSSDLPPVTTSIISGVLDVAKGGTGASTLPARGVLVGDGSNPIQSVAPGANGEVLTSNGTSWTSAAIPATNWGSPGAIGSVTSNSGAFTTLTTAGNVGIGSTQPSANLDVAGEIKIQGGSPGSGKVLTSDASGLASWTTLAVGSVTSVNTGVGLSGGPITGAGSIRLADTAVTPGTYHRATLTVDQQGRLTAASSGAAITDADIDVAANIAQSKVDGLSTSLGAKEPTIVAGTNAQYWRGDKSWQTLNTTAVTEGVNQYFTPARAISSLSSAAPIVYSTITGTIGISKASGSIDGYISSADWTIFNNKQNSLGFTPVNRAGDTLTGSLSMSGQDVTNTGNILMTASKILGLSNNSSDPVLSGASDKGKIWFNSTNNELKFWDGSAVKTLGVAGSGLQSFNGQTTNSQTLAMPGGTGTAPNWSSNAGVHTLNIPMASAAGVTAGLVSAADYTMFNSKIGAVTAGNGVAISSTGTTAMVSLTAVGTAGSYAKITTDSYGRVTAGTTLSPSDIPPIPATLIASGELPIARGGTGLSAAPTNGQLLIGSGGNFALGTLSSGAKAGVVIVGGAGSITLDTAQDIRTTASPTFSGLSLSSLSVPLISQAATSAPAVSVAGQGKIYFDQSDNEFKISQNGGSYTKLASGGTVTNIAAGTGLTGGPITSTGTISLSNTAVTPGSYTRANISVDAQGRLTAAQSAAAIVDADISASAGIAQSKVTNLTSDLAGKESSIAAGTNAQYWRGDKSWQTLSTTAVGEGVNQYFTPARAISSLSSSAPITYSTVTGTIGISQASGTGNGYLSSTDWTTFNSKQNTLGFTPINKAGDTLAGALNAGGFDLTNIGNIQMASSKAITLSNNVSDPAGLTAADKGRTWFNSTSNQMKYWDGTLVQTVGAVGAAVASLNGQTGASQSFGSPGTAGTAPAWSSTGNVHTLNIPMASTAAVTGGLLSNADYAAFNAKQSAGNYITALTGDITSSGFASGSMTATLASVVTAGTSTKVSYDAKGRVTSGASLAAADIPALSAAIITSGTLSVANGGTGTTNLAANSVVLGNGSGPLQTVPPGTSGNILTSNGTTWTSAAVPATNWAAPGTIGSTTPSSGSFTTLQATGNVGIGTTTPNNKLEVVGAIKSTTGGFIFPDGTTQTTAAAGVSSQWSTSGSNISFSGGNVGIGSATPAKLLDVAGLYQVDGATGTATHNFPDQSGGALIAKYAGTQVFNATYAAMTIGPWQSGFGYTIATNSNAALLNINVTTASPLVFSTSNTERMRILSGGNVGIGTNAPSAKLHVSGQVAVVMPANSVPTATSQVLDWNSGNLQVVDLSSATGNVTLTMSNPVAGASYGIKIIQGANARNIVWPPSVKWPGGVPYSVSTVSGAVDFVTMFYDGSVYYAAAGKNYQ